MSILEICAIVAIPVGLLGLIVQSFLSAYIKAVGIKTAWRKILHGSLMVLCVVLYMWGIAILIMNIAKIDPNSLNICDVISICLFITIVYFTVTCIIFVLAFKRLCSIITVLQDRIKTMEEIMKKMDKLQCLTKD